jgi:hypothetical protein
MEVTGGESREIIILSVPTVLLHSIRNDVESHGLPSVLLKFPDNPK